MPSIRVLAILTLAAGVMLPAAGAPPQDKGPAENYHSGPYLFKTYCASCHGDGGKGDGPVSDLLRRPTGDLTRMAQRNGGVFPREHARTVIAAPATVPAHVDREMPAFANVFRVTESDDPRVIDQRVDALVKHLEALQAKPQP